MGGSESGGHEREVPAVGDGEAPPVQQRRFLEVTEPSRAALDGESEPERGTEAPRQETARVLSDHFISESTTVVLLLCLYSVLCIFLPAVLGVRANPAVMQTGSKPEWYFLFLYEYVRFVPPLVGALTPAFLLVLLGAWPFLDRNPSRDPRKRILALVLVVTMVIAILALTYAGWVG